MRLLPILMAPDVSTVPRNRQKEFSMNQSGEFMTRLCTPSLLALAAFLLFVGCAHRPINPPITQANPKSGYRFLTRPQYTSGSENMVVLAFGRRHSRCGVLIRRPRVPAEYRNRRAERQQGTPARLCQRDHRRVRRKLYGACLRPLW